MAKDLVSIRAVVCASLIAGAINPMSFAAYSVGGKPDSYNAADPVAVNELNDLYSSGQLSFSDYNSQLDRLQKSVATTSDSGSLPSINRSAGGSAKDFVTATPPQRNNKYLRLAQQMMRMPANAASQLSQTWCGQAVNPQTILERSNGSSEVALAAQAMAKLDQWYPSWTSQVDTGRISLVVTDQMPLVGQQACTCILPNSSRAFILVSRQMLVQAQPPKDALLLLIENLRHENYHDQAAFHDGPGHQNGSDEEAKAVRTNADVLRKAAKDPEWSQNHDALWSEANYDAFYADLIQRQQVPFGDLASNVDVTSLTKPYYTSLQFLKSGDGFSAGQLTYLSSQPNPNGTLTFLWQAPNGRKLQVTPTADGTCALIQQVGDPSAQEFCNN